MDSTVFERLLNRPPDSHKYQYGHVLVIGGSPGMVGAPLLTGTAALRTGAGLVTIAAPGTVADKLERRVKEIMTLRLPADLTAFIKERKVSVAVIGPGLKPDDSTADMVRTLADTGIPLIIDGGALQPELLPHVSAGAVLTPHAGEFQRLLAEKLPKERSALRPTVQRFAEAHQVTVILKGQPTYVAHPDGSLYENPTGNPGLATAGTGDVLSGVIAGMIAQHIEPGAAAEAAVYLHGLAGDIAAKAKTQPGMTASDVIESIPEAYKTVRAAAD